MGLSWKVVLAPFIGAAFGWLASKGLSLDPNQQAAVITLLAGAVTALGHWWHTTSINATIASLTTAKTSAPPSPTQKGFARVDQMSALACVAALIAAGCSSLGLATATTFNEKLAVGYESDTAIVTSTDTLLKAGKITAQVASNIEAQCNNLKAALDIANTVEMTNATDGGNQLAAALTALNALSSYLATLQ